MTQMYVSSKKIMLQEIYDLLMVGKCWLHGSQVGRCSENIHH